MKWLLLVTSFFISLSLHAEECISVVLAKESFGADQFWMTKKFNESGKYYSVFLKSENTVYHSDLFHCYKEKKETHCVGDDNGGFLKLKADMVYLYKLNLGVPIEKYIQFNGQGTPFKHKNMKCPKRD